MQKKRVVTFLVLMIFAVGTLFGFNALNDDSQTEASASTYEVTAEGYGGPIRLMVYIEADEILDIEVLGQNETANLGDKAIEEMIAKILSNQSTNVDVQSGATASSNAVIKAVNSALEEAGLTNVEAGDDASAEAEGESAQQVVSESKPEDPAAEYDLESYEPEGILISGKGFQDRYDIYFDVIFDGNEIVEIRVIEHNETKGFGDGALRVVPERIISQQTTDVDIQAGATWTSQSIMRIVQEAVEQAGVSLSEREDGEASAPAAPSGGGGT